MKMDDGEGQALLNGQEDLVSSGGDNANQVSWRDDAKVAISTTGLSDYCFDAPFHPPSRYPELGSDIETDPRNQIYYWVRETLFRFGLDRTRFDTPDWNPLGDIVKPGMTVFIKPNTVSHYHVDNKNVFSIITHASVIRPLLDYVRIALRDEGRIIVGDSQFPFSDFDKAMQISGLEPLITWFRSQTNVEVECFDLRQSRAVRTWMGGRWGRTRVEADPRGYRWVDLGERSRFAGIDPAKLRIGVAPPREMTEHHRDNRHEYLVPQSVLNSDAVISIPKLKTHRRAAVSLSLKGFFGLVAHKGSLPHYTVGSPIEGGDEYIHPSFRKRLYSKLHDQVQSQAYVPQKFIMAMLRDAVWHTHRLVPFKDPVLEAKWYGNDTVWRTILDLYDAVFLADKNGHLCDRPQRNHFCLIDGIIAGEKNGPVAPDPVTPGVLLAGLNPPIIDVVAATLMGFDYTKIPTLREAAGGVSKGLLGSIEVMYHNSKIGLDQLARLENLHIAPHPEWTGHIELKHT